MKKKVLFSLFGMLAIVGLAFAAFPTDAPDAASFWTKYGELLTTPAKVTDITAAEYAAIKDACDKFMSLTSAEQDAFAAVTPLAGEPAIPANLYREVQNLQVANQENANDAVSALIEKINDLAENPLSVAETEALKGELDEWLAEKKNFPELATAEATLTTAVETALAQANAEVYAVELPLVLRDLLKKTSDNVDNLVSLFPTTYAGLTPEFSGDVNQTNLEAANGFVVAKLYVKMYNGVKNNEELLAAAVKTFATGLPLEYYNAANAMVDAKNYLEQDYVQTYFNSDFDDYVSTPKKDDLATLYKIKQQVIAKVGDAANEKATAAILEASNAYILKIVTADAITADDATGAFDVAETDYKNAQGSFEFGVALSGYLNTYKDYFEVVSNKITRNSTLDLTKLTATTAPTTYATVKAALSDLDDMVDATKSYIKTNYPYEQKTVGAEPYVYTYDMSDAEYLKIGGDVNYKVTNTTQYDGLPVIKELIKDVAKYDAAATLMTQYNNKYKTYVDGLTDLTKDLKDGELYNAAYDYNHLGEASCKNVAEFGKVENWKWDDTNNKIDKTGTTLVADYGVLICKIAKGYVGESFAQPVLDVVTWLNTVDAAYEAVKELADEAITSEVLTTYPSLSTWLNAYTTKHKALVESKNYAKPKEVYEKLSHVFDLATDDDFTGVTGCGYYTVADGGVPATPTSWKEVYKFLKDNKNSYVNIVTTDADVIAKVNGSGKNIGIYNAGAIDFENFELSAMDPYFIVGCNLNVKNLTIVRTTNKDNFRGLFLPCGLTGDQVKALEDEGIHIFAISGVAAEGDNVRVGYHKKIKTVVDDTDPENPVTTVEGEPIYAYKPYMVKDDNGESMKKIKIATPVVLEANTATTGEVIYTTAVDEFHFVGTRVNGVKDDEGKPDNLEKGDYVLGKTGWVWAYNEANATPWQNFYVGGIKVHSVNNPMVDYVISMEEVDGDVTAIEDITLEKKSVEGIYTINGVKVNSMSKPGLYIVNGKKYLKK